MVKIVPVYAALLAFVFLWLSVRVIRVRGAERVAVGAGASKSLERAMRVHANFAEYAPLALVLLLMAEMRDAPAALVHGLCLALLLGRGLHAFGMSQEKEDFRLRVGGMSLTFAALAGAALTLLWRALA
jgi:uncharacterized membrane protein YecN with MAPEG domain